MRSHARGRRWRGGAWARATLYLGAVLALIATFLGVWRGDLLPAQTITGLLVVFSAGFCALLPVAALVTMLLVATARAGRRAAVERVASAASVLVFGYAALWLVRHDAVRGLFAGIVSAVLGILVAEGVRRLLVARLEAGLLADLRRSGASRAPHAVALLAVLSLSVLLALAAGVFGARSTLPLADTPPAKRVLFLHIDGVARDHFAYWMALRPDANLEAIVRHGASGHVAWPAIEPPAALRMLGTPRRDADRVAARQTRLPGVRAVVASALTLGGLGRALDPSSDQPSIWALAEAFGVRARMVGWERSAVPDLAGSRVVAPSDHEALVAFLDGDSGALDHVPDAAMLRRLQDLARRPQDDWRRGARLTEAEARAVAAAGVVGATADGLWRDRFLLRAFVALLGTESTGLAMVRLGFGRDLSEALDPSSPDGPLDARDGAVAYLDVIDDEIVALRRALRAGDALVLLVTSPGLGGSPRPAPLVYFGEKAASQASVPDALEMDDLTLTLLYLLGIGTLEDASGRISWGLLAPGLAEHMPPEVVVEYGRLVTDD